MTTDNTMFIEAARERYAYGSNNDIEIDDLAIVSHAENGVWVQGWLWLPIEADEADEAEDGD